jgi:Zn-finger nucleic acid-binding protein
VEQRETTRKVNAKAFVHDFARGASEDELCEKYTLTHANFIILVDKLRKAKLLTQEETSLREENLKIRFGSSSGPPKARDEKGRAVDQNTGLVLHCPACGGPVARGASHCEYCRSALDFSLKGKTIPCPHCFTSNPADSSFCMRCARPLKGLVRDGEIFPDRLCPRCEQPMSGKTIGEFPVIACGDCQGFFISTETFEMMQSNSTSVVFPVQRITREPLDAEAAVKYIRCPVCRTIMNRTNFARISGVIIDSCSPHGIWFDGNELEKIMAFISRGGLQKAKEKELEELKAEEKRMKIRNINVGASQAEYGGRWGSYGEPSAVDLFDVVTDIFRLFKK